MTPNKVLLMRHAEKSGDPMDPHLSDPGQVRAQRLADYIPTTFWTPDFVFAAALSKHSARSYETVVPLAKKIGVPIDATFADQDYAALATELLSKPGYSGKLVLICWHHGNIPSLAWLVD
jgi:broad specificity phosphatase PhoE